MTFKDIALPIAKLGIPVFPLLPKVKEPPPGMKFLEEATTDPNRIEQWNVDNPNYNVAMLADGDFGFLEFDITDGIEKACAEKHQPRLNTREQLSGKGGQHFIFKMNDDTKSLGNRSVSQPCPCDCDKQEHQSHPCAICLVTTPHHHHEWFSFRARNKYLVGAGSIHPNGKRYKLTNDAIPSEMPAWLADWIRENSSPRKTTPKPREARLIHDEFNFEDFCLHYGIEVDFVRDGVWQVVKECPGVGRRHRGSKLTAFFWDGESLGWSCFAQACPTYGMTIGGLIKLMNQSQNPYTKPIWVEDEPFDKFDIDFLDIGFDAKEADVTPISELPKSDPNPKTKEEPHKSEPTNPKLVLIGKIENDDEHKMMVGVRASDITPKLFTWLWPDVIPVALTLWVGKPDNGKTLSLLDLAARVSRGDKWPDGAININGPRTVLYAATEDNKQTTLVPRLMAVGANLENIVFPLYNRVQEKANKKDKYDCKINLKEDLKLLKQAVLDTPEIGLIILDPMNSYWPDVDENKAKEVAPVLEAIAKFCEETGVTVIGLIHHSKRTDTDALGKVLGSVRVGGIARAVWEISKEKGKDASEPGAIRMALVKGNVHKKRGGMTYHIEGTPLVIEGQTTELPRVIWDGKLDKSADDLLEEQKQETFDGRDKKKILAKALITSRLANGPQKARDMYKAAEDEGISDRTMKTAVKELGILVFKEKDGWIWSNRPEESKLDVEEVL